MQVVLASDTHVKSRAPELAPWVREALRAADHVVHVGDFDSRPAYEEVRELAADLTAVGGNMDRALDLPDVAPQTSAASGSSSPTEPARTRATDDGSPRPSPTTPRRTGRRSASWATPTRCWTSASTATASSTRAARPVPGRPRRRA